MYHMMDMYMINIPLFFFYLKYKPLQCLIPVWQNKYAYFFNLNYMVIQPISFFFQAIFFEFMLNNLQYFRKPSKNSFIVTFVDVWLSLLFKVLWLVDILFIHKKNSEINSQKSKIHLSPKCLINRELYRK